MRVGKSGGGGSGGGGSGDVAGPAGATDTAIARYNGATGKIIKNSSGLLSDTGAVTGIKSIDMTDKTPPTATMLSMQMGSATNPVTSSIDGINQNCYFTADGFTGHQMNLNSRGIGASAQPCAWQLEVNPNAADDVAAKYTGFLTSMNSNPNCSAIALDATGYWDWTLVSTSEGINLRSGEADGAAAVAYNLDTENALSNASAKLLSLQNNTAEKFAIDKDGNVTVVGTVDGKDVSTLGTGDTLSNATSADQSICRYDGANNKTIEQAAVTVDDTGNVIPKSNQAQALGSGSKMWTALWTAGDNAGLAQGTVCFWNNAPAYYLQYQQNINTLWTGGFTSLTPYPSGSTSLGTTTYSYGALYVDNGATDGGAVYFNQGTSHYVKSDASGNTLKLTGGQIRNVKLLSAATYDVRATDYIIHSTYSATAAVTNVKLLTAQVTSGRVLVIKDGSGNAGTNNITVTTEGSELIDGAATAVINSNYSSINLYCNGTNWFIF